MNSNLNRLSSAMSTCRPPASMAPFSRVTRVLRGLVLALGAGIVLSAAAVAGSVEHDLPANIDPDAKYLFYMHGFALEIGGPRAAGYNYTGTLKELANRGFVVIGEQRSRVRNDVYADKVAAQVRKPPRVRIVVASIDQPRGRR